MLHRLGYALIWVGLIATLLVWMVGAPVGCHRYCIGVSVLGAWVAWMTRWQPVTELHRLRALCEKQLIMMEAMAEDKGIVAKTVQPSASFDMTATAKADSCTVVSQHVRHTPQPDDGVMKDLCDLHEAYQVMPKITPQPEVKA